MRHAVLTEVSIAMNLDRLFHVAYQRAGGYRASCLPVRGERVTGKQDLGTEEARSS